MSIHFISGKPRGGKTLYSVRLIVDELVNGNRMVVTNVALKLDVLNEYLQKRMSERKYLDRHITERVYLMDDAELSRFFTIRAGGVRVDHVANDEWKRGVRPDYSVIVDDGILYVLDEVHIAFNSRAWADTGAEVLYYLSQHAKLGDDVVCITQSVGNVDKQFRSVAQDFTYIVNAGKTRMGVFRLPSLFVRSSYAQVPTSTDKPMETGTFTLDVSGLAACYDTAKGVGIHGRMADKAERKKGVHWGWALAGVVLLVWLGIKVVPWVMMHKLVPGLDRTAVAGASSAVAGVAKVVSPGGQGFGPVAGSVVAPAGGAGVMPASGGVVSNLVAAAVELVVTNELWCTGYIGSGHDYTVFLSDGSSVDTSSGRIKTIERSFVVVDGVKLDIRKGRVVSPSRVQSFETSPGELRRVIVESVGPKPRGPLSVQVTPGVGGNLQSRLVTGDNGQ